MTRQRMLKELAMHSPMRVLLHLMVLIGVVTAPLHAAQINDRRHLPPGVQVKINNALAKSYVFTSGTGANQVPQGAMPEECGDTRIGTIAGGTRAARIENTVVARGDVITINRHTRCR